MEWSKQSIELPPGWHKAVSDLARELGGNRRGLTRYVWAVAASLVLTMDAEQLREGAKIIREIHEEHPDALPIEERTGLRVREIAKLRQWLNSAPDSESASPPSKAPKRRRSRAK